MSQAQHHANDRDIDPAVFPSWPGPAAGPTVWRSVVMQVRHILQGKGRDVVAISADATIAEAARLLTDRRIGALIVKSGEGSLSGIISERDLVQAIAQAGAAALTQSVADHMTPDP